MSPIAADQVGRKLRASPSIVIAMVMGIEFRGLGAVMDRMRAMMAGGGRGVMGGRVGLFRVIMFCRHAVMMGRFFVMLCGGVMAGAGWMLVRHGGLHWVSHGAHTSPAKVTCQRGSFFANFGRPAEFRLHENVATLLAGIGDVTKAPRWRMRRGNR